MKRKYNELPDKPSLKYNKRRKLHEKHHNVTESKPTIKTCKISLDLTNDLKDDEESSDTSCDENSVYLVDKPSVLQPNQKHNLQNSIPLDAISHIFTFLSPNDICKAATVCYNWANAARRPTFWSYVNRISFGNVKHFAICKRFTTVSSLKIDTRCSPSDIAALTSHITNIRALTITPKTNLNSDIVPALLQLKHLRKLNISKCSWIDSDSLCYLFQHLTHLQDIDVSLCPNVNDTVMQNLCQICTINHSKELKRDGSAIGTTMTTLQYMDHNLKPKIDVLERLNVSGCVNITDQGLKPVIRSATQSLRSLNVKQCSEITDESVILLGNSTHCLTELDLSFCFLITDRSLKNISNLTNIEYLNINWCSNITDEGFQSLEPLKSLKHLYMNGLNISDQISDTLPEFSRLEDISLSNYGDKLSQMPIIGLHFLTELKSLTFSSNVFTMYQSVQLSGMPSLTKLDISWCRFQQGSLTFLRDLLNLEYLSLRKCEGYVEDFASIGSLQRLRHLDLTSTGVTDAALRSIVSTCPRIQYLYIGWCSGLSERVAPYLAQMPSLIEVDVSGNELLWRRLRSAVQRQTTSTTMVDAEHRQRGGGGRRRMKIIMEHVPTI